MYYRCFTSPDPAYGELVAQLYGVEAGAGLYRAYIDQLSRRDLWAHRLDWTGLAVYDAGENIKAHAILQATKDRQVVYVGFVESVDDQAAASYLVGEIRQQLGARYPGRAVYMPVNLSIWHNYRFKIAELEPLPFEVPTQPYYARFFKDFFPEEERYSSCRMQLCSSVKGAVLPEQYRLRELSLSTIMQDLRAIYDLSVCTFESEHSVPGFEEFKAIHIGAAGSVDPQYVLIAEQEGEPVGFIYSLKRDDALYVKTLAVLPRHQGRGVARPMYETVCRRAMDEGCRTVYGLTMRNDRSIMRLLPPDAEKVAEYVLYKET